MRNQLRYAKNQSGGLFAIDMQYNRLDSLGDPLVTLSQSVNFEGFRQLLEEALYSDGDRSRGGRPPYDPIFMFKILVLQQMNNLSDDAMERMICDRLSYQRFLGLTLGEKGPDAKTIWLFRDTLTRLGLVGALHDRLVAELAQRQLVLKKGEIMDASFVEAPRQRNTREENQEVKAGRTPEEWKKKPAKLCQKDVGARWTKKGDETHFGYKNHVISDAPSKLITDYLVTDASVHDGAVLLVMVEKKKITAKAIYADAAYRSSEIEEHLAEQGIESRIHERPYTNKPLSKRQKARNRRKSRVRARGEHIFAFMTQSMGGMYVRARSLARNAAHIGLKNISYNLCRITQLKKNLFFAMG